MREANQLSVPLFSRSRWLSPPFCALQPFAAQGKGHAHLAGVAAWGLQPLASPDLPFGQGSMTCLGFGGRRVAGLSSSHAFP